MGISKLQRKKRIQYRIRKKINGTAERPRLSVYRSNKEIYCQAIDDSAGITLFAVSSREAGISKEGTKVDVAKEVGKLAAERAKANNISRVVFDRGGNLYHGRIKALAEGAREGGLSF